jgi:hypothetical protein
MAFGVGLLLPQCRGWQEGGEEREEKVDDLLHLWPRGKRRSTCKDGCHFSVLAFMGSSTVP